MSDDAMPTQPDMPKLQEAPQWAIGLSSAMKEVQDSVRVMQANIEIVANELIVAKGDIAILQTERAKHSAGVRQLSSNDAGQEVQLAQERMAREALAAKVDSLDASQKLQLDLLARIADILGRIDRLTSNPTLKGLVGMLLIALTSWLASRGITVK